MTSVKLRVGIFLALIIAVLTLSTGNVLAQNNNVKPLGWTSVVAAQEQITPPSLSVNPINGPEDIPAFREALRNYFQQLRVFLAQIFNRF
jgi:hypothetical protein